MFGELQSNVRFAIMSVLAALYESGLVEEVELGDVLRLFGVEPLKESSKFSFTDPGWIEAYIDFREHFPDESHKPERNPEDLNSNRKLH